MKEVKRYTVSLLVDNNVADNVEKVLKSCIIATDSIKDKKIFYVVCNSEEPIKDALTIDGVTKLREEREVVIKLED